VAAAKYKDAVLDMMQETIPGITPNSKHFLACFQNHLKALIDEFDDEEIDELKATAILWNDCTPPEEIRRR
jgi:hypothetical protein